IMRPAIASLLCPFSFLQPSPPSYIPALSLHDALPIFVVRGHRDVRRAVRVGGRGEGQRAIRRHCRLHGEERRVVEWHADLHPGRSEEHTSELQSLAYLVCRLLLEKKNK